jgi:hypothetical protein
MRDTPAQNSHGTGEDESLRFSQVLRRLADAPEERLSVHNLVEAFGERAFGALMLCVGLLNMLPWPPGGTTLIGAPLLFITAQLTIGRHTLWLPRRICAASFNRANFRAGLLKALPTLERIERLTKPRLSWAVGALAERLIGAVCFLLTLILVLPIPGGNFVPAAVIATFAVALVQRDGAVSLLAWLGVTGFVVAAVLLGREVWQLIQTNWAWFERLIS